MTRTLEWNEWRERRRTLVRAVAEAPGHSPVAARGRGRRTRTDEDEAMITRMVVAAVEQRRAEGRLVRIGEREYELRLRRDE